MAAYHRKRDNTALWILGVIGAVFFLVVFILVKSADKTIDEILSTADPVENLIAALDSKNPQLRDNAADALDNLGDPLLLALAPACEGQPVSTSAYMPTPPGPHPIVILQGNKSFEWTYDFLKSWGPPSRQADLVELVACVTTGTRRFQTCEYESGSSRARFQLLMTLDIVEASTGKLVDSINLDGSEPRKCPPFLILSTDNTIYGSQVTKKDLSKILLSFYE